MTLAEKKQSLEQKIDRLYYRCSELGWRIAMEVTKS